MNKIFSLKEYKEYLINFNVNKYDESRSLDRKEYIECRYSDEQLNKIIIDTEKFVLSILKEMYTKLEIFDEKVWIQQEISTYIFQDIINGCTGGWYADNLFCPDEQNMDTLVSEYLIKSFFGEKFTMDIYDDLTENYDEIDDVGFITCNTYFNLTGPRETFVEILDTYFLDRKCLVKK